VVKLNVRDRESIQRGSPPLPQACGTERHQEGDGAAANITRSRARLAAVPACVPSARTRRTRLLGA